MFKEIPCDKCNGTGKMEISICDECGEKELTGEYQGKQICQICWSNTLTDEEITSL